MSDRGFFLFCFSDRAPSERVAIAIFLVARVLQGVWAGAVSALVVVLVNDVSDGAVAAESVRRVYAAFLAGSVIGLPFRRDDLFAGEFSRTMCVVLIALVLLDLIFRLTLLDDDFIEECRARKRALGVAGAETAHTAPDRAEETEEEASSESDLERARLVGMAAAAPDGGGASAESALSLWSLFVTWSISTPILIAICGVSLMSAVELVMTLVMANETRLGGTAIGWCFIIFLLGVLLTPALVGRFVARGGVTDGWLAVSQFVLCATVALLPTMFISAPNRLIVSAAPNAMQPLPALDLSALLAAYFPLMALLGLTLGVSQQLLLMQVAEAIESERLQRAVGQISAAFTTSWSVGQGVGPILAGILYGAYGLAGVVLFFAPLFGLIAFGLIQQRREESHSRSDSDK